MRKDPATKQKLDALFHDAKSYGRDSVTPMATPLASIFTSVAIAQLDCLRDHATAQIGYPEGNVIPLAQAVQQPHLELSGPVWRNGILPRRNRQRTRRQPSDRLDA